MSYLFTSFKGDSLFFLLGDPYKWLEDVVPAWVMTWDTSTWDEKHVVFSNERCETMSFPMKFFWSFSVSVSPGHSSGLCCHSIRRPRRLLGTGQHLGWSQVTVVKPTTTQAYVPQNCVVSTVSWPQFHGMNTVLFCRCVVFFNNFNDNCCYPARKGIWCSTCMAKSSVFNFQSAVYSWVILKPGNGKSRILKGQFIRIYKCWMFHCHVWFPEDMYIQIYIYIYI